MARTLGIDLGTYNSSAATSIDGKIVMIESVNGRSFCGKNFPSFILFDKLGQVQCVGDPAKRMIDKNPELVAWGFKRLVGISMEEAQRNGELKRYAYPIRKDVNGNIIIDIGKTFTPQDLLTIMLKEIKRDAEDERINPMTGGMPFDSAVITVPAYFKAFRTQPVIDAAKAAGFKKVEILAEPTAAAIRYGYNMQKESVVLAFDIGAGTLDVSLLQIQNVKGEYISSEIGISGNEKFGGIDIDEILFNYLSKEYRIGTDLAVLASFRKEVEKAKIRLSKTDKTPIELPNFQTEMLTRELLEKILEPELNHKLRGPIQRVFQETGRRAEEVDNVLFIGGPVHMPIVRRIVLDELKRLGLRPEVQSEIRKLDESFPVDPMDAVAQGAALYAAEILKPVSRVLAEGYGTIIGKNKDVYLPLIQPNASYPIFGSTAVITNNTDKRIPVSLVAKVPDLERPHAHKYHYLGDFSIAIDAKGECPIVEIKLTIDEDKSVIAQLTHRQTGQKTVYKSLNFLTGREIELKEGDISQDEGSSDLIDLGPLLYKEWQEEDLERVINAANSLLAEPHQNLRNSKEYQNLKESVKEAIHKKNPSNNGPDVWNRCQEYLSILLANQEISNEEYQTRKNILDQIMR